MIEKKLNKTYFTMTPENFPGFKEKAESVMQEINDLYALYRAIFPTADSMNGSELLYFMARSIMYQKFIQHLLEDFLEEDRLLSLLIEDLHKKIHSYATPVFCYVCNSHSSNDKKNEVN